MAAQIKSDRAKHDAKGKQVESSRREETEKTDGDQNRNDDGENSKGTAAPINQEKLDELCVPFCNFRMFSYWLRSVS